MPPTPPPEKTILRAKPHWVRLFGPAIVTGFGLFCSLCSLSGAMIEPRPNQPPPPDELIYCLTTCGMLIFLTAILWVLQELKGYFDSEFILTNRRIIFEQGGFRRKTLDMYLKHIDSLYVEESILGRLLNYGTINIRSGASQPWRVKIARAEQIRHYIQEQIAYQ